MSIVGNAYIGTGLMAACMIFFRERFALWQSWLRLAEAAQDAVRGREGGRTAGRRRRS